MMNHFHATNMLLTTHEHAWNLSALLYPMLLEDHQDQKYYVTENIHIYLAARLVPPQKFLRAC